MKILPSIRTLHAIAAITCLALLSFAVYLQVHNGLEPCPLCAIQRIILFFLGLLFLIGALHVPKLNWRRFHNLTIFFIALLGIAAAERQVWLESLPPDQTQPCMPSLDYMLQSLPLKDVANLLLSNTTECTKISWSFLSLSVPSWTLLFFSLFALIGLIQALRANVD